MPRKALQTTTEIPDSPSKTKQVNFHLTEYWLQYLQSIASNSKSYGEVVMMLLVDHRARQEERELWGRETDCTTTEIPDFPSETTPVNFRLRLDMLSYLESINPEDKSYGEVVMMLLKEHRDQQEKRKRKFTDN